MPRSPFEPPPALWEDWWTDAACRIGQGATFFPTQRGRYLPLREAQRAKAICARCRVQQPCLEAALLRGEREGIWGGMTPRERAEVVALRMARPS